MEIPKSEKEEERSCHRVVKTKRKDGVGFVCALSPQASIKDSHIWYSIYFCVLYVFHVFSKLRRCSVLFKIPSVSKCTFIVPVICGFGTVAYSASGPLWLFVFIIVVYDVLCNFLAGGFKIFLCSTNIWDDWWINKYV